MKIRVLQVASLLAALTLAGCGKPSLESLRESFTQQIASIGVVRDFQHNGDELAFSGPDGAGSDVKWRIHIDSAVVEPYDDEMMPYRGIIQSSWYANGQLIEPTGSFSNLPIEFLDEGVSQDCWAFWETRTQRWDW